jgi:hypothetical protein
VTLTYTLGFTVVKSFMIQAPSLLNAGKVSILPKGECLKGAPLRQALDLPERINQIGKACQGQIFGLFASNKDTKFYNFDSRCQCYKTFFLHC